MKLSTQLGLSAAALIALVTAATGSVWRDKLEEVVESDARDEAAVLAVALASSHYADVAQQNDAQIQLDFEAVASRVPEDVAYLIAVDAHRGERVIAAVPKDLVGAAVPDVVPLSVTREARPLAKTFLLREANAGSRPGDPVIDAREDVRLRDGTRVGSVRVGVRYERSAELLRRTVGAAVRVGLVVLALALALAVFLARRVSAPVASLGRRMAKVAGGALDAHGPIAGPREVRDLAAAYDAMVADLRRNRALERYVPLGARRAIDGRPSDQGIVAPRRERVVVLFADLRGFSTLSEKRAPAEVLAMLTEYSDAMTEVIVAHGGDVNELLGDAVLAVFTGDACADDAVRAAREMQARLADIADGTLRMGVGLHMGEVVLGTVGSGDRLKFAVVGDTVNVAARIQERSKGADQTAVFASAEVKGAAGDEARWIDRGEMSVRGREGCVHLFELASA